MQAHKIDAHTHILPEKWPDLRERYGYGGFIRLEHHRPDYARMMMDDRFFREIYKNCWHPEARMEEMDKQGVQLQVISTVPVMFSYWAKGADAHDLSKLLNDDIAQTVNNSPDRFLALGTLPLQSPQLAVKELERCVNDLGLSGVQIGSHVNDWNLDAAELFEVFAAAETLGAAVFVHPWDMMGQADMQKYWLPWLVGMPAEMSRAICSMIFGGVLERLPDLRIAFAHGGGSFPATLGRIEHGFNVRPDLCAIDNDVNPREYIKRIYFDSGVHDESVMKWLVEYVGSDRIMMGSDYPFPLGEHEPGQLIESLDFAPEEKEMMLSSNALDWLGVSKEVLV